MFSPTFCQYIIAQDLCQVFYKKMYCFKFDNKLTKNQITCTNFKKATRKNLFILHCCGRMILGYFIYTKGQVLI